jgi:predicted component of type VI protein secretion system
MDPQAAWRMLLDAYLDRDWPLVAETAQALLDWLDGCGFVPRVSVDGARHDRTILELVCRQALQLASSSARDAESD